MRTMPMHICALLALALVACTPAAAPRHVPTEREMSSGGEQPTRMGNVAQRDIEGSRTVYKTTEAAGVHTPHFILDSGSVTASSDTGASADYDTGGGTDTVTMTGIAVPASGGAAAITGDTTNGLDTDVTRTPVPSTFYHGQTTVTTAGTEVTLGASQALTQGCWVKAKAANTGFMYVGLNPVTSSTGYELDALEQVFVPVANRTTIYVDSSVNAEAVSYVCF